MLSRFPYLSIPWVYYEVLVLIQIVLDLLTLAMHSMHTGMVRLYQNKQIVKVESKYC